MTRHDIIAIALTSACYGQTQSLTELIYLLAIKGEIPLDRLVKIALRQFDIPNDVSWSTIFRLCPTLIQ
jgi:hypothetical protein